MRCKACNAIMTTNEMVVREETGQFDELCTVCRKASENLDAEYEVDIEFGVIKRRYPMEGEGWDD